MTYISLGFYLLVLLILILYYAMPLRFRWVVLLIGSITFYYLACREGCLLLFVTALMSYALAVELQSLREKYAASRRGLQRLILLLALLPVLLPWLIVKNGNFTGLVWAVPLGISFYTLQTVSYLVDVYRGRTAAQKNPAKYLLFVLFFPQIVQGPIPRYEQLSKQLYEGHRFHEERFVRGLHLILWGFFLEFMIADKAAIVVSTVFDSPEKYAGCYILVAAVLYSIELYADFMACVSISQGTAGLFGIALADNFKRPYFSTSIQEFWRRWHISLSSWLRDYIYIPLGGGRKGAFFVWNPWVFFDDSLLRLGLGWKEWCILLLSMFLLLCVSILQEKGMDVRGIILHKAVYVRWALYILAILCIMVFGTYGFGYQGQDFIYGGF